MRNGNTDLATMRAVKGGLDGGGWVTGIRIADDGWMVCRTDCAGIAGIRGPNDSEWTQLFRFGENFPASEYHDKCMSGLNPTSWIWDVAIAPSNSNRIYASFLGFRWRSDDRAQSWVKLTAVRDQTETWHPDGGSRQGGTFIVVDPANPDVVVWGHPINGADYSTDAGVTFTPCSGVLDPVNSGNERKGVSIAFDRTSSVVGTGSAARTQTLVLITEGRGVSRSTTGVAGTFSAVGTGGPTSGSSIDVANGRIYVIGYGGSRDGPLSMWNGSAWSQPDSTGGAVQGRCVQVRPGNPGIVLCMTGGGGQFYSSNAGNSWAGYMNNVEFKTAASDAPYLAKVNNEYMSLGAFIWHPTLDRVIVANGIGVFTFDNLPRTAATQLFQSITVGIQQKLPQSIRLTPSRRLLVTAQDKPLYIYPADKYTVQPSDNLPDYDPDVSIRHADSVDFARDNENYMVLTYTPARNLALNTPSPPDLPGRTYNASTETRTIQISSTADVVGTWAPPPVTPYVGGYRMNGGGVAVSNTGNIVWASTGYGRAIRTTLDGGANWQTPVFRLTEGGASVDVSEAYWHGDFSRRREFLWAEKSIAGCFYIYVDSYTPGGGPAALAPYAGIHKSTDGGLNFVRVFAGEFFPGFDGPPEIKVRPVPGTASNHIFIARGPVGSHGDGAAPGGLKFLNVSTGVLTELPGWSSPDDVAFGKGKVGSSYLRIMVKGWRGGVMGYYYCDDFNPANPTAATWNLWTRFPKGRADDGNVLCGDPSRLGLFFVATQAGGFQILERDYKLRAS